MKCNVNSVAYFFSKNEQPAFWPLSNMAGGMEIFLGKHRFHSSEQLYQACKYLPNVKCVPASATGQVEPRVQKRILETKNARASKMTQKCAVKAGLVRPDWEDIKVDCMLWVLELKLKWNPDTFGAVLKSTEGKMIVEKSKRDDFWGCLQNGNVFDGKNELGQLLVKVRDNFDSIVKERRLTHPDGFLIL